MAQALERRPINPPAPGAADQARAVRILAKSLFRQLKESGYENRDIVALSAELVGLITTDLCPPTTLGQALPKAISSASSSLRNP